MVREIAAIDQPSPYVSEEINTLHGSGQILVQPDCAFDCAKLFSEFLFLVLVWILVLVLLV